MQDGRQQAFSRSYVAAELRRLGYSDLADVAARELPDPVDLDQLGAWGMRHGLTRDKVINRMGGSP